MKLTPKQRELLKRHVSIDGDGNVVGNDNTVHVTKQEAGDYAVQIGEQRIAFNVAELRCVQVNIKSTVSSRFPPKPDGRCDYYRHIPLPPHYVPRPEVVDATRAALLESADGIALTSAIQQTPEALHGMGGIGKTVVARALCDDPEVQESYPDGILWTTLGRELTDATLRSKLREWIDALGGIVSETAPTLDRLKGILAQLLEDRACLLIVDDVWRRNHAEAFQVGGPRCCLLITTRDAEIARGLGARLHAVDVMRSDRAVELLEEWAGGKLDAADDALKEQIVARVGCLPLAVKLAGEQLRRHDPVRWLERFDARKLRSPRPETVHDSLFQTFSLSLEDLTEEVLRCYTALTIFPEDEPIPLVALSRLWGALVGLDEGGARDLMHDLAARALVQLGETALGLVVTLHDLLRDFIAAELGEQGAQDAHHALLDAYRATKEGKGWHTAPDDGYLYDHLAYHLDALADHDEEASKELQGLFASDAWLHARVPADDYRYDGYLTDLALLWQRVHEQALEQIEAGKPPQAIAENVHCALIQTTVSSLVTNYVPELVSRAVETELWSPARGLSVLRKVTDVKKQAHMATLLLRTGRLSEHQRVTVRGLGLDAACAIWEEWNRVEALAALAPQLTGGMQQQALEKALTAARAIKWRKGRVDALASLIPQLPEETRQQVLEEGLAAAHAIGRRDQVEALAALAPQLTGDLLTKGLDIARTIGEAENRVRALAALAPQLTKEIKQQALTEGLAAARAIRWEENRAEALAALVPQLTNEVKQQALTEGLDAARNIVDKWYRAQASAALAPQLTGKVKRQTLAESLTAACAIEGEKSRAQALAALAPQLAGDLLAEGLAGAREIRDEEHRTEALAALAPRLEGALLTEGLATACAIEDKDNRAETLAALAPQLTGDLLKEGLDTAQMIGDAEYQAEALAALASHLAERERQQALEKALATARAIGREWDRAETLAALTLQLTGKIKQQVLAEALNAACAIEREWDRVRALAALAPRLEGKHLAEGLIAVCAIEDAEAQAYGLAALSPQLMEKLLVAGLLAAYTIVNAKYRAAALAALVPQLAGETRQQVLVDALDAARTIDSECSRAKSLAALVPQLTGEAQQQVLTEALAAIRGIDLEINQAYGLTTLAPHLEGELLMEGLATARAINEAEYRAEALAKLAPQLKLTGEAHQQALAEALVAVRAIEWEWKQAEVLAKLAPQLVGKAQQQELTEALDAAQAIKDAKARARGLSALTLWMRQVSGASASDVQRMLQVALVLCLRDIQYHQRSSLFRFLTIDEAAFLRAFDLPQESYARIAQSIIDICTKWEWL